MTAGRYHALLTPRWNTFEIFQRQPIQRDAERFFLQNSIPILTLVIAV
jgi:hypothetical protein